MHSSHTMQDLLLNNIPAKEGLPFLQNLYAAGHSVMDIQHMLVEAFRCIGALDSPTLRQQSLWFGVVDLQDNWATWWKERLNDPNTRWGLSKSHLQQYSHKTTMHVMYLHMEEGGPNVSASVATAITLYTWALANGWYENEPISRLAEYLPYTVRYVFPMIGSYARSGVHQAYPHPINDPLVKSYSLLPLSVPLPVDPVHMDRFRAMPLWYDCIAQDISVLKKPLDASLLDF